ncbi:hypothetical protein [Cohnella sp. WQ 127256]|uniref:hypothetical protein n=1 Tax=Cohnella sp. WQ 127256 TaxID=2938790 RepID=UPI0021197F39|nr:hypothetical protein [Cohnella sp. WQ 127256]
MEFGYCFIDDNQESTSSALLQQFAQIVNPVNYILIENSGQQDDYARNETTHYWNEQLIWKVADFKNSLISKAIEFKYDYILLIDSDVLLHPGTVDQLLAAEKDIISEIPIIRLITFIGIQILKARTNFLLRSARK